ISYEQQSFPIYDDPPDMVASPSRSGKQRWKEVSERASSDLCKTSEDI
ncbi:hypothetical protein MTO96_050829, partial [Rhipicephalus appendiculatus]